MSVAVSNLNTERIRVTSIILLSGARNDFDMCTSPMTKSTEKIVTQISTSDLSNPPIISKYTRFVF